MMKKIIQKSLACIMLFTILTTVCGILNILPVTKVKAASPTYVSTFECIGLYWNPGIPNQGSYNCTVQYREPGSSTWKDGYDLWYDGRALAGRPPEFRGSIVGLSPGTKYEVKLTLDDPDNTSQIIIAETMSEDFPIGTTEYLPLVSDCPLVITSGGSVDGYKLYTFDPANGSAAIDVDDNHDTCITISGASYVIIRGLTLKDARKHGILLTNGAHHIVIEECDISNWGSFRKYETIDGKEVACGNDWDSGVFFDRNDPNIGHIIIQRNKIHDPRYSANSWDSGHPMGPNGIGMQCNNGVGHNIFRYNEIYSTNGNFFNDCIQGMANFSFYGCPGPDSDVYGNICTNSYDDALEMEGGGMNVRVWGNYMDQTATGVATGSISLGPIYIFRNVLNRCRTLYNVELDKDDRLGFAKSHDHTTYKEGRRYIFHNTMLQAEPPSGTSNPFGGGSGIDDCSRPVTNTVSRNNIFHIWKSHWFSIDNDFALSDTNDYDYDLYNGKIVAYEGAEPNGINAVPVYLPGHGPESGTGGQYQLAPASRGYHEAVRLKNFNDMYETPDIGAHQSGTPPMKFGVNAYRAIAIEASANQEKLTGSDGVSGYIIPVLIISASVFVVLAAIFIIIKICKNKKNTNKTKTN